jgi:hypothetical protein
MTLLEKRIQEFEARPASVDAARENDRAAMLDHFSAINRFEGLIPSTIDKRLFHLLAASKISKQEYLDLCLSDARGTA